MLGLPEICTSIRLLLGDQSMSRGCIRVSCLICLFCHVEMLAGLPWSNNEIKANSCAPMSTKATKQLCNSNIFTACRGPRPVPARQPHFQLH